MVSHSTADWMANLPQPKRELPLSNIVIPGSHDSGSFYLDTKGPMAADVPDFVKYVAWIPGAKTVACNWGKTQELNFKQQLEAGIRYFDLRVAVNPTDKKIYFVHTLYGPKVDDLLTTVNTFLAEHSGEIVFLDFNHFYGVTEADHKALLSSILSAFGSKLCSVDYPVSKLTLEQMAQDGKQVIVFYKGPCKAPEIWKVVTRASILSPWPNTTDPGQCIEYLKAEFAKPPVADFLVCQGVLTPTEGTIAANLCGNLRKFNSTLSPLLMPWLQDTPDQLNIVLADFVDEADFINTVLNRNSKLKCLSNGSKLDQQLLW